MLLRTLAFRNRLARAAVLAGTLAALRPALGQQPTQPPGDEATAATPALPTDPAAYVPQVILPLLHAAEIQAEIGIQGTKLEQLEQLFAKVDGQWWRARNLPLLEQRAAIAKVEKVVKTWLTDSLPRGKLIRLADLERRAQGGRVLLRSDVAKAVGLSSEDRGKLLDAACGTESAAVALGKVLQAGAGGGDVERAALLAARERELRLPGELLSQEQQKK